MLYIIYSFRGITDIENGAHCGGKCINMQVDSGMLSLVNIMFPVRSATETLYSVKCVRPHSCEEVEIQISPDVLTVTLTEALLAENVTIIQ